MAEVAVGFLLENLENLLKAESKSFFFFGSEREENKSHSRKGVKIENLKEEIRSTLRWLKIKLGDDDSRQGKEVSVHNRARSIIDVCYRIENFIDTFGIYVESRNKSLYETMIKRIFKKITREKSITSNLYDLQLEIDDIKMFLKNIKKYIKSSGTDIDGDPSVSETQPNRELSDRLIEDIQVLIPNMLDERKNYRVISICGMVGIGKTTLARNLCNHHRIRAYFDAVAFVQVSQKFSHGTVFQEILLQFSKIEPELSNSSIRCAQMRLFKFLQRHKCLIILDKIPSKDAWERLRIAFPLTNTASKLLITTRSLEVAELSTADGKGIIHTIKCLTEYDALKLFIQYAKPTLRSRPELVSEMNTIGRYLASQCKGLPLGIVKAVTVFTSNSRTAHNFTGLYEKLLQSLSSIYFELPYQLKSCLLYLATFRKGTDVRTEKLYDLWIAEGVLSSNNYRSETVMHIAESYLNELRLGCMVDVQEEEVPTPRRFKSCSLHNLIHDLCLFIGRQEEFIKVVENEHKQESDSSNSNDRARRVVLYVGKNDNIKYILHLATDLRCLMVRNAYGNQQPKTHVQMLVNLKNYVMQSKNLRILDFDRINFGTTKLPDKISDLIHLRYISFNGCQLQKLPISIGNLPCLQILDLRVTGREMEIPNVLHKIKRLRHLYLPLKFQTHGGAKLRLNGLTQLETLENFDTELCDVEDLFTLTKIWHLTVNINGNCENLERLIDRMNVTSKHLLRSTVKVKNIDCYSYERSSVFRDLLACTALHVLHMEGYLGLLPQYTKFSSNITKIVLSGSGLQYDPMPILEKLPKLGVLVLQDDAFIGKEIICSATEFPELRRLELSNLYDLESWIMEDTAMPKLSTLLIKECSQLKMLPDGLRVLTNLRELKILKMPKTFKYRLSVVDGIRGEDMDKVPQGTSIIFDNEIEPLE